MFKFFKLLKQDFQAALENDPAVQGFWGAVEIIFTYAGFHSIISHRIAHGLWKLKVPLVPRVISQIARFITGIEIHPGARIGGGFFVDHGSGVVVGATTIIGENCMLFQGVTLGGTGKETGKRHPTLGDDVLVSAGAKVLGNITIGDSCKIGAMSVVLKDVPPNCTVVGVPGRIVIQDGQKVRKDHKHDLNHQMPDPVADRFALLQKEIDCLHQVFTCVSEEDCEMFKDAHTGEFSPTKTEPTAEPESIPSPACTIPRIVQRLEALEKVVADLREQAGVSQPNVSSR